MLASIFHSGDNQLRPLPVIPQHVCVMTCLKFGNRNCIRPGVVIASANCRSLHLFMQHYCLCVLCGSPKPELRYLTHRARKTPYGARNCLLRIPDIPIWCLCVVALNPRYPHMALRILQQKNNQLQFDWLIFYNSKIIL